MAAVYDIRSVVVVVVMYLMTSDGRAAGLVVLSLHLRGGRGQKV